jgi:hypothetical protein
MWKSLLGVAIGFGCSLSVAEAGPLSELRGAVLAHNTPLLEGKNAGKEASPNLAGEVVFNAPDFLKWAGAPRPYLSASVNTGGDTSFAALGLEWTIPLGADWMVRPGLGYAGHTGAVNNPFPNGDPRATAYVRDKVLFGSEDLFRISVGVERKVSDRWAAGLLWEHYSHGHILGEGRNQGIDEVGVRFSRRIGD